MIYYTDLPDTPGEAHDYLVYLSTPITEAERPTLPEIQKFLGARCCTPHGELMRGELTWARARLWEVLRRTPYRNAVPAEPEHGLYCRCRGCE